MIYLKDHATIETIITGPDFAAVGEARKRQISTHFEGMQANHRPSAYSVLIATLPAAEGNFVVAIFSATPGDPALPSVLTNPANGFTSDVLSVGDGAVASLEAIPTVGLTVPSVREIYQPSAVGDDLQKWLLVTSTAATVAGKTQRPLDFNNLTNPRVWFRK